MEVDAPNADFTLFIVGTGNADFALKVMRAWCEVRKWVADFSSGWLQWKSSNGMPISSGILNSNRFQPLYFENSYLPIHNSDLSNL